MDGLKRLCLYPGNGTLTEPGLMLASDRVVIDAVGVSLLKLFGAKGKVGSDPVLSGPNQTAAELGFGVRSEEIKLIPLNYEAR